MVNMNAIDTFTSVKKGAKSNIDWRTKSQLHHLCAKCCNGTLTPEPDRIFFLDFIHNIMLVPVGTSSNLIKLKGNNKINKFPVDLK